MRGLENLSLQISVERKKDRTLLGRCVPEIYVLLTIGSLLPFILDGVVGSWAYCGLPHILSS